MKKVFFLIASSAVIMACQPKVVEVVEVIEETDEVVENIDMAKVEAGESIYANKCSKCHDAPVVKDHSVERWNKVLPIMSKKAELTADEDAKVNAFVYWKLNQ